VEPELGRIQLEHLAARAVARDRQSRLAAARQHDMGGRRQPVDDRRQRVDHRDIVEQLRVVEDEDRVTVTIVDRVEEGGQQEVPVRRIRSGKQRER